MRRHRTTLGLAWSLVRTDTIPQKRGPREAFAGKRTSPISRESSVWESSDGGRGSKILVVVRIVMAKRGTGFPEGKEGFRTLFGSQGHHVAWGEKKGISFLPREQWLCEGESEAGGVGC